jgi:hypothetical protein
MLDVVEKAFNYLDAKLVKVRSCIESYAERGAEGAKFQATVLTIIRTTEQDILNQFALPDDRITRMNLRAYIIDNLYGVE